MSANPTTATKSARVTKRTRQPKDPNETPQRARKRALDREAQRTFREKTKNYIAHLVATVEKCKAESESQLVKQLLDQNAELYSTIEHLRKILTDIYTATEPEISRPNTINRANADVDSCRSEERISGPGPPPEGDTIAVAVTAVSTTGAAANNKSPNFTDTPFPPSIETSGLAESELVQTTSPAPAVQPGLGLENTNLVPDELLAPRSEIDNSIATEEPSDIVMSNSPLSSNMIPDLNPSLTQDLIHYGTQEHISDHTLTPGTGMPHSSWFSLDIQIPMQLDFNSDAHRPDWWTVTNTVYNKIFGISPSQAAAARGSDSGVVFKAIKNGWDALSASEMENPVMQILRDYDNLVADHLDQVNRVAIAYKNYLLIKYYLNPDTEDLERMPHWQRPRPSQRRRKHPILIDFFAWPGLRERLIRGDTSANMESSKFSSAYIKYFQFLWPFSFEETYQHCESTDAYFASPLFERYHRDLRCWSMQEKFFWEYPELIEDITSPDSSVSDTSEVAALPPTDCWLLDIMHNMPNTA